ncbi:hypothetical protein B0H15DRAFT_805003 [Mycena belliarum]|uniref:Secreted protein n=1 Tax=Mycena belliarum TaxID=1033014 RepID=A0AAD6TSF6_9AGAR|nr:hypothetical protein B0H15DRAFT_805003 [Mycena belliae]
MRFRSRLGCISLALAAARARLLAQGPALMLVPLRTSTAPSRVMSSHGDPTRIIAGILFCTDDFHSGVCATVGFTDNICVSIPEVMTGPTGNQSIVSSYYPNCNWYCTGYTYVYIGYYVYNVYPC